MIMMAPIPWHDAGGNSSICVSVISIPFTCIMASGYCDVRLAVFKVYENRPAKECNFN